MAPYLRADFRALQRRVGLFIALAILPCAFALKLTQWVSAWIPWVWLGSLSAVSFWSYRSDKSRAESKEWRYEESHLLGVDLLGGWFGGYLAQQLYRHKTSKLGYRVLFTSIVVLHQLIYFEVCSDFTIWRLITR